MQSRSAYDSTVTWHHLAIHDYHVLFIFIYYYLILLAITNIYVYLLLSIRSAGMPLVPTFDPLFSHAMEISEFDRPWSPDVPDLGSCPLFATALRFSNLGCSMRLLETILLYSLRFIKKLVSSILGFALHLQDKSR